jgi:hypothetical protein
MGWREQKGRKMAVAFVYDFPGMSRSLYDDIMHDLDLHGNLPGMIFHAAGEQEDGFWRAVEVWETQEDWENFFNDRYSAALRARQLAFDVTPIPVHNFLHSWSV